MKFAFVPELDNNNYDPLLISFHRFHLDDRRITEIKYYNKNILHFRLGAIIGKFLVFQVSGKTKKKIMKNRYFV